MSKSARKPAAPRRPAPKAHPVHPDHGHLLERLLFLSDAVFAIVMTLLVLELRFPEGFTDATLTAGLAAMAPKFIAFATSFAVVAIFWMAHATFTRALLRFDGAVALVNLAFLFTLTVTPFAAALLGEMGAAGNAWRAYCLALMTIGGMQAALVAVICRGGGRLVGGITPRQGWSRIASAASPALGFAVALALSLAGYATAAQFGWLTIPLFMWGARAVFGPR